MKHDYIARIEKAKDLDELNIIVEQAAFDEELTNDEYCEIVEQAVNKARTF